MNIGEWLVKNAKILESAGIGTSRLDAEVLLADALKKDRAWLIAHPEFEIPNDKQKILEKQIKKRLAHTPLAYIRQKTEFYGRDFYIDHSVLEPRPESETMIELCLELFKNKLAPNPATVWDVGTGSGALAITLKLERPELDVYGVDIDPACLIVANQNKQIHKSEVNFIEGNLLEPASGNFPEIIVANLPYIADGYHINPAALHEPKIAIFGGPDGLDYYRQMFKQSIDHKNPARFVLTESMPPQHNLLKKVAEESKYKLIKTQDFIQIYEYKT